MPILPDGEGWSSWLVGSVGEVGERREEFGAPAFASARENRAVWGSEEARRLQRAGNDCERDDEAKLTSRLLTGDRPDPNADASSSWNGGGS